jgi:leucyl-tRNA synthetase
LNFLYECRRGQEVIGISSALWKAGLEVFTRLLAPIAPFIAEEVWQEVLGHKGQSVHQLTWLSHDESALAVDEVTVVVQVNGKLRDQVTVPIGIDEELLKKTALASEKVQKFVNGKAVKKIVVVPQKLVNIVVG